jgi:hypothetical protein
LKRIKKGTTSPQQILAGQWVRQAGIELSEYVIKRKEATFRPFFVGKA